MFVPPRKIASDAGERSKRYQPKDLPDAADGIVARARRVSGAKDNAIGCLDQAFRLSRHVPPHGRVGSQTWTKYFALDAPLHVVNFRRSR